MKVYHGSTFIVKVPNLNNSNFKTDFGAGFYTTTDIEQAKKWSKIKKKRLEEKNIINVKSYVNVYEFEDSFDLNILEFKEASKEWLEFVFSNRNSEKLIHNYDMVIGPVANDNLYQTLVNYESGVYDLEETIKRLKTYALTNQYSFHTEKSLECLKYIETIEVI